MVVSVARQEAGDRGGHDLRSPSGSDWDMNERCFDYHYTGPKIAVREVDTSRSCARTIPLGAIGGANSRIKLPSPVAPSLIQSRETGACGNVPCLGELQINADCGVVSNYCSFAPLSSIVEEGGATPTYVTTSVEPVAPMTSPVLSLQQRTLILSIGGTAPSRPYQL